MLAANFLTRQKTTKTWQKTREGNRQGGHARLEYALLILKYLFHLFSSFYKNYSGASKHLKLSTSPRSTLNI